MRWEASFEPKHRIERLLGELLGPARIPDLLKRSQLFVVVTGFQAERTQIAFHCLHVDVLPQDS